MADAQLLVNTRLFSYDACGFSFRHPWGWHVDRITDEDYPDFPCFFGARPPNWNSIAAQAGICLSDYAVYVAVSHLPSEQAIDATPLIPFFYAEDGRWFAIDPVFEEFEVPVIKAGNLSMIRNTFNVRVYGDCLAGGLAGIDSSHMVFIFDEGENAALIVSQPQSPGGLEVLVTSFSFFTIPQ